jgi:hypothetical protein
MAQDWVRSGSFTLCEALCSGKSDTATRLSVLEGLCFRYFVMRCLMKQRQIIQRELNISEHSVSLTSSYFGHQYGSDLWGCSQGLCDSLSCKYEETRRTGP